MNWNLIMRNENNDDADDADMIALAFSSLQFRFVLACAWLNKVEQQDDTWEMRGWFNSRWYFKYLSDQQTCIVTSLA